MEKTMKFLNLYLIVPFLALSYANIGAVDAEKPATSDTKFFNHKDPLIKKELDELDRAFVRNFYEGMGRDNGRTRNPLSEEIHTKYCCKLQLQPHIASALALSIALRTDKELANIAAALKEAAKHGHYLDSDLIDTADKRVADKLKKTVFTEYTKCIKSAHDPITTVVDIDSGYKSTSEYKSFKCREALARGVNASLAAAVRDGH